MASFNSVINFKLVIYHNHRLHALSFQSPIGISNQYSFSLFRTWKFQFENPSFERQKLAVPLFPVVVYEAKTPVA